MRGLATTFLVLTCSRIWCQIPAPTAISDSGYSHCFKSSCLFVPNDDQPKTYRRDDLSYTTREDGEFVLMRNRETILATRLKDLSASVFVTWSENDEWLAITWSQGGSLGSFDTRVFHVFTHKTHEVYPVKVAYAQFKRRHYCETRGDNVQAYGWDQQTKSLVLVTSVYPTGDCGKDAGRTEAYLVRPTDGAILSHLTPRAYHAYVKTHPQ